jgi:hypothetical protein
MGILSLTGRVPAGSLPAKDGRRYTTTTVIDSPSVTASML